MVYFKHDHRNIQFWQSTFTVQKNKCNFQNDISSYHFSVFSHVEKKKKRKFFFKNNLIAKTKPAKGLGVLHYFLTNTEQGALNRKKILKNSL